MNTKERWTAKKLADHEMGISCLREENKVLRQELRDIKTQVALLVTLMSPSAGYIIPPLDQGETGT